MHVQIVKIPVSQYNITSKHLSRTGQIRSQSNKTLVSLIVQWLLLITGTNIQFYHNPTRAQPIIPTIHQYDQCKVTKVTSNTPILPALGFIIIGIGYSSGYGVFSLWLNQV